jgi:hypothetical protein
MKSLSYKVGKNCRSYLGWYFKEEIFAAFFILVILALANNEKVIKKIKENTSVQIAIGILVFYCIYNKIPWSFAFLLVFVIGLIYGNFLIDAKETIEKMFVYEKQLENPLEKSKSEDSLMKIGARVLNIMKSKPKSILKNSLKKEKALSEKKTKQKINGLSKKVKFKEKNEHDEMCGKVSEWFGFDEETENDTTDCENDENDNNYELRKKNLLDFAKDVNI